MKEYIEREAVRKYFHLGVDCKDCEQDARRCQYFDEMTRMDICSAIDDIPAADVVEVRHGRWIRTDGIAHGIVSRVCSCSLCKRNAGVSENGFWYLSDYCPNCGAKMTEV